jgi:hypothetical protein
MTIFIYSPQHLEENVFFESLNREHTTNYNRTKTATSQESAAIEDWAGDKGH